MSLFKPVDNHPEEICCTECWQRGISWGSAGREDEIIKLIEANTQTMTSPLDNSVMRSLRISPSDLIALIKGENE